MKKNDGFKTIHIRCKLQHIVCGCFVPTHSKRSENFFQKYSRNLSLKTLAINRKLLHYSSRLKWIVLCLLSFWQKNYCASKNFFHKSMINGETITETENLNRATLIENRCKFTLNLCFFSVFYGNFSRSYSRRIQGVKKFQIYSKQAQKIFKYSWMCKHLLLKKKNARQFIRQLK